MAVPCNQSAGGAERISVRTIDGVALEALDWGLAYPYRLLMSLLACVLAVGARHS